MAHKFGDDFTIRFYRGGFCLIECNDCGYMTTIDTMSYARAAVAHHYKVNGVDIDWT